MPRSALKMMPRSSPFQTFVEVLCEELRKSRENRELQDNVKQLQGDVDKFQDSLVAEAMERAREVYERARVENPIVDASGRPVSCLGQMDFSSHWQEPGVGRP